MYLRNSLSILIILVMGNSCVSPVKPEDSSSLEGQEWTYGREIAPSIGAGKIWKFFSKNRFEYTEWYSGGAYWTRHYQGSYKYDSKEKKVFLMFDSNQNLAQDNLAPKMAVQLHISKNDTIPIISNSWKYSSDSSLVNEQEKVFSYQRYQKVKFGIKKTTDTKSHP